MADSSNPFADELARRAASAPAAPVAPTAPDDPFTAELQRRQAPPSAAMNANQLSAAFAHQVALPAHAQSALDAAATPPPADPTPEYGAMPGTGDAWKDIRIAAKTIWTADPNKLEPILKSELPDATFSKDKSGNVKMGYRGGTYYLNKPGLSEQDVLPLATSIATFSGIGRLGSILGRLGGVLPGAVGRGMAAIEGAGGTAANVAKDAATGAATGLAMTAAAQGSGAPETSRDYVVEGGVGAAGGALGQLVASTLGRAMAAHRIGIFDPATGDLTVTARAAFRQAGIDPGALPHDTLDAINTQLRGRAVSAPAVAAAQRTAIAGRYGMPVTTGQATGDLGQIRAEEAMRQGARGGSAESIMGDVARTQADQVPQVAENVAGRVAPGAVITPTETGAGDVVAQGLQAAERQGDAAVQAAYGHARELMQNQPVTFPPGVGSNLPTMAQAALTGRLISPDLAPATSHIIDRFNGLAQSADPLTLDQAEIIRKEIGSAIRSARAPEDRAAAIQLRNTYDRWLDGAVQDSAAHGNIGDPAVLQALQQARAARRSYGQLFEQQNPKDKAGALIEAVVNGQIQPQALVDRMMGGQRGFDVGAAEIGPRIRQALGDTSPAWQTIQRSAVMRIMLGNADQQAKGLPEFRTMLDRVNAALAGRGQASVSTILGARGVDELQNVRDMLNVLQTPREAMNYSRSGWAAAREKAIRGLSPYIGAAIGAAGGGRLGMMIGQPGAGAAGGGAVGLLAGKGVQDLMDTLRALRAARGYVPPLRVPTVQVGPASLPLPIPQAGAATAMGLVPTGRPPQ